jgi:hypothetical protein
MNSPFSRAGAPRIGLSAFCIPLLLALPASASTPAPGSALLALPLSRTTSTQLRTLFASPTIGSMDTFEGALLSRTTFHPIATLPGECCTAEELFTPAALVVQSSGAILADVNAFRALLGNPNNGTVVGQLEQGHREINWDAVPPIFLDVFNFPPDFFNNTAPRGLVYDRKLRGLEVSSRAFTDINPTYGTEFVTFSGARMFSPLGTNTSDVSFFVSGTDIAAGVRGFGVVFLDVDNPGSTGLELYGADGELLAAVRAPVRSDAHGASFVGVIYADPIITRVTIIAGDGILSPSEPDVSRGGVHDIVVMDDFIYGEPTARQ